MGERTEQRDIDREGPWAALGRITRERDDARAALNDAHFLLCWTYQSDIETDPPKAENGECAWRVWHLHPGVRAKMNSAEQTLYDALMRALREEPDNG